MKTNTGVIKWIGIGLLVLWLAGFIQIPLLNTPLFFVFGHPFTLHHLLLLLVLGYIVRFLPGMLQTVVIFLIVLWLLSTFIFPAFGGLGYLLLIILILYILFSFL